MMEIGRSRMQHILDAHIHLFADTDCILRLMDRQGIEKSVVLAMGMENPETLEYNEAVCFKHARNHPER